MKLQFKTLALGLLALPAIALAHPQGHADSLMSGFSHPWLGTDHLLAMLAVGMLAATQANLQKQLTLMLAFLLSLIIGVYTSIPEYVLPSAEYLVSLSVGLLGLSLLLSKKLQNWAITSIIIASGLLHGIVHGAEIPSNTQSTSFVIGMLIASAILHLGGLLWLSWGVKRALPYFRHISACGLTLGSLFLLLSL